MTENISRLISVLNMQSEIYAQLYNLSVEKRDAIEAQNIEKLNQIVKDEQPLLIRLRESERARIGVLSEFSPALGIQASKITIQNIIDMCPPSFIAQLEKVHGELSNALQAQASINEVNRKLINARLEYISFMMNSNSGEMNNAYGTGGADVRVKPAGPRMIDLEI